MRKEDGSITTGLQEIADMLEKYWQRVFKREPVHTRKLESWLNEEEDAEGSLKEDIGKVLEEEWEVKAKHVKRAFDLSGNSAPGPDGIPYLAWRRLGVLGQGVILGAVRELGSEEGIRKFREAFEAEEESGNPFNEAVMAFLPKKPCGEMDGLEVYTAECTRPLSIVNTDNRLMASSVRWMMEPILGKVISQEQKGFLRGRSMLADVVEVEDAMMEESLKGERAAGVFFDFRAAFPSIAHKYLLEALRSIGLPEHVIRAVEGFYDGHEGIIRLQGRSLGRIRIQAGIRQGCPLSPLLFALVCDLFLKRLIRSFKTAHVRAYADDIAMICPDFLRQLEKVDEEFEVFGDISGMRLHYGKVQVVPLWVGDLESVRSKLGLIHYKWRYVKLSYRATYPGFEVGPEKKEHSWDGPVNKFLKKSKDVGRSRA